MSEKPKYFKVRRNGRAFFELGRARAERAGVKSSVALGPYENEPESTKKRVRAKAWALYAEWLEKSGQPVAAPSLSSGALVAGSVGQFFQIYRTKEAWRRKEPATQKEWEYCWGQRQKDGKRYFRPFSIGAYWADTQIDQVSPDDFERFYLECEQHGGGYYRWRMVRIARALFNAAIAYHIIEKNPGYVLKNRAPKGRTQFWTSDEINKLIRVAFERGNDSVGLAIWIAWETAMSPVDIRTLVLSTVRFNGETHWFQAQRRKTAHRGEEVGQIFGVISPELYKALMAYYDALPDRVKGDDEPILRTSRSLVKFNRVRLTNQFAAVRLEAFGEDEKRQFRDIRRSANLEADLGGASVEDRAAVLANAMDKSPQLDAVYTPPTVERARKVAEQRRAGRAFLEAESVNRQNSGVSESGNRSEKGGH